jgi:hypothetical protein
MAESTGFDRQTDLRMVGLAWPQGKWTAGGLADRQTDIEQAHGPVGQHWNGILRKAAEQGLNILFCVPNRATCTPHMSVCP